MKKASKFQEKYESPIYTHLGILDVGMWPTTKRNYIFLKNGSVGKIVKYKGIQSSGFTEVMLDNIVLKLKNIITSVSGDGVTVSFTQRRKKMSVPEVIDPNHKGLTREMKARIQQVKDMADAGELFEDEFYIGINVEPDYSDENVVETFKRYYSLVISKIKGQTPADFLNRSFVGVNNRVNRADSIANTIKNALVDSIGSSAEIVEDRDDILKIYRSFIVNDSRNKADKGIETHPAKKDSLRQVLFSGVNVKESRGYFELDGTLHRLYTLDRFNPKSYATVNDLKNILEAPFEFTYTVNFRNISFESASKKFSLEVLKAKTQESKTLGTADMIAEENTNNLLRAYEQWADSGENAVEIAVNFIYKEDMAKVVDRCEQDNIEINEYLRLVDETLHNNFFSGLSQSEWRVEELGQWLLFNRVTLPAVSSFADIHLSGMVEIPYSLSHLLPIYSETDLSKFDGISHFYSESGTIVDYKIFSDHLPSFLSIVVGDMGSGKSILLNTLNTFMDSSRAGISGKDTAPFVRVIDFAGTNGSFFKRARMYSKYGTSSHIEFMKKMPNIQILELNPIKRIPNTKKLLELTEIIKGSFEYEDEYEAQNRVLDYYQALPNIHGEATKKKRESIFKEVFEHSVEILDYEGDFIELLELKEGDCVPNKETFDTIMSIFEIILSDEPKDGSNNYNAFRKYFKREDVYQVIKETYEKVGEKEGRFPFLRDVLATFEELSTVIREDGTRELQLNDTSKLFIDRLKNFTAMGSVRNFDRKTDIDMTANFVLFDLVGLDKHPKVFSIMMIFLLELIDDQLHSPTYKDRPRAVFLDEAGMVFSKSEQLVKRIVKFARTSRKHKFACILASQLPSDFILPGEPDPNVIVSQARTITFCGFANEHTIKETVRYYNLPEGSEAVLRSLGVRKDRYSKTAPIFGRFYMIQRLKDNREKIMVLRNILSKYEATNSASSLDENMIIKYFTDVLKMDLEDTYDFIAEGKHLGDEGLIDYLRENNLSTAIDMVKK